MERFKMERIKKTLFGLFRGRQLYERYRWRTRPGWKLALTLGVCLFVVLASLHAQAAVSKYITYQGKLTDAEGNPLTRTAGTIGIIVKIYNSETGGTLLIDPPESFMPAVTNGIFNIDVGVDLPFDEDYWIELVVGGQTLSPRHRLTIAGYAIRAGKVSGAALTSLDNIPVTAGTIPTARLDAGTGANQLVRLDADSKLPAVDGSALTNVAADTIADNAVTSAKIKDGEILDADVSATAAIATSKLADATDITDAITNKHSQNTDTALGIQTQDLNMGTHKLTALSVPSTSGESVRTTATITEANLEDAITKRHTQNTDTALNMTAALGDDHDYSGLVDSAAVGESVVFGDLLYYDWAAVKWKKAKADSATTMPAMRIALESKGDGELCLMLVQGYIRDDSASAMTAAMVYVSEATAGTMTSTAPSTTLQQLQRVGVSMSAHILFFDPSIDVGEI